MKRVIPNSRQINLQPIMHELITNNDVVVHLIMHELQDDLCVTLHEIHVDQ